MEMGLTAPKWVLIVQLKIPKMSQNLSAQFVCPKVLDFNGKRLHWASVVRVLMHCLKRKLINTCVNSKLAIFHRCTSKRKERLDKYK